jgi:hypothetical protein
MLKSRYVSVVVLVMVSVLTMIRLDRPLIRGDGVAYLAWIDTFVRDRDLDLTNQFERFQPVNTYQITWDYERERYVDIFPFGVAFLQAPFYVAGAVFVRQGWLDQNPGYFIQMQGVQQAYSVALMIGANLMALVSIVIAWRIARAIIDDWSAALVAWGMFVGTPLVYYSTVSPLNSHNPGAFLAACLVYLLVIITGAFRAPPEENTESSLYVWLALGLVAGLMVVVRWQLLAVVACAWGLLAWQRRWKGLAAASVVAVVVMLPIPLVWNYLFGKPFVVPYDETTNQAFLRLPVHAHQVLFRMVRYSPILLISLLGLPVLWRINRAWALFALAAIGSQVLINGSTRDWYGGDSYGARRMSELYILYALLAAVFLGKLPLRQDLWQRRSIWPVAGRVVFTGLIVYSIVFMMAFFVFSWTNEDGVFADTPERMLSYFFDRSDRMEIIDIIFQTHLGPSAWSMPRP